MFFMVFTFFVNVLTVALPTPSLALTLQNYKCKKSLRHVKKHKPPIFF